MGRKNFGDTTRIQSSLDRLLIWDKAAQNELLALIQGRLYEIAQQKLQKFPAVRLKIEADDVVQKVNERLLGSLRKIPKPNSAADITNIIRWHIGKQLLNWAKKYHHEKPVPNGSKPPVEIQDLTSGPATLAQLAEYYQKIETLDHEHQQLFDLIEIRSFPLEQVAAELGVSLRTVTRKYREARIALHKALNS